MSTLAAAARGRVARVRIAVGVDALALGAALAFAAAVVGLTWWSWGDIGRDTGYDLVAGARVAHGELPYVDFVYYYGPLAPLALGLFEWIGGSGIAAAVALGLVLVAAIVAATYAVARTFAGPVAAFVAAAITAPVALAPTNFSYVMPHSFSAPFGVLALLGVLLGLQRFAASRRSTALLLAGTGVGVASLTRPEFELAALVAAGLWLAYPSRVGVSRGRAALLVLAPAALVPATVYGAFLTRISAHRLVLENLYPVDQLREGPNRVLKLHAPLTPASFAHLAEKLVVYAAGAAVLVLVARLVQRRLGDRRGLPAAAAAVGVVAGLAALARPESVRYWLEFAYGWIPAGAVLVGAALVWRGRRRQRTAADAAALAALAALAVLAAKDYAVFFVLSTRPQPAVYALPFAAILLTRLHLVELARTRAAYALGVLWLSFLVVAGVGLAVKDARAKSAVVHGPGGSLTAAPDEAAVYRSTLTAILQRTRPGEPVLVAPQLTALYALAQRPDPLPQLSLLPGALPRTVDERAAIGRLEAAHVRLVALDRHRFTEYGQTSFGESFDRTLGEWVRGHFRRVATYGSAGSHVVEIWVRRGS